MDAFPHGSNGRHLAGLGLSALLGAVCYFLYLYLPGWIRGTPLQTFGHLATLVAVIGTLSLAERVWASVVGRLDRKPPGYKPPG